VSRAEIGLPGVDPYDDRVYDAAAANFARLRRDAPLVCEDAPSLYFYRLGMGAHVQTGVAAAYSLDEYDRDVIKKHERTRRDKEDDRTRHMIALKAQTGPVFLTYRASDEVGDLTARATATAPLFEFDAPDGVRHTVWRVSGAEAQTVTDAFSRVPLLYIADGHHRAASAARARDYFRDHPSAQTGAADGSAPAYQMFLAVAFPHDQMQILPYNRIVRDLGGLTPAEFVDRVRSRFDVGPGTATPSRRGEIAMYEGGRWWRLTPRDVDRANVIGRLDVSVLEAQLLDPVLNIKDIRTDKRIDFVGGARGPGELQRLVDGGRAAVAFSMYPVSIDDLMTIADAGAIMPPKSTWFEPKLRDGLLIHMI
jgi:uncharacterized protein (DUF1015 family)